MQRMIAELVALAGPAYFFLQLLTAARYRGRWRLAALVPLVVMLPLAAHAGLAYSAGAHGWPMLMILASPMAFLYLLILAILKGATGSTDARARR
jgi:hypothetical protein